MASFLVAFFTEPYLLFSIIGRLGVVYGAWKVLQRVWQITKLYVLAPIFGLAVDVKSFGEWAVVTGSTEGIGREFAEQLASKGMKLVLISLFPDQLAETAKQIEEKYKDVEVKCIQADFREMDIYDNIQQRLEGLDIGVLVNNVGIAYENSSFLHKLSDKETRDIMIVNTFSVAFMSKVVLKGMLEKKKGLIINLASITSRIPSPLLSIYGATKAFVRSLSKSMHFEYSSQGIVVQCISPSLVSTAMSKFYKTSFYVPTPQTLVSSCLPTVTLSNDIAGCLGHEFLTTAYSILGEKYVGERFFEKIKKMSTWSVKKSEEEKNKSQ